MREVSADAIMPKLLLADDSVTIQRVIELTFADEQIQVIAVGDGQQAIFEIEQHRPDIVLADVGMPQRDGYEVAAFVKRTPYLAHIPVLLLTGAFEPVDEARARAVGCDGVLAKPFEPQMVINRVKDLLAGRRPASLWSDAAAASGAAAERSAASPAPAEPAAPVQEEPKAVDSLDEYFDRLDAAFSKAAPPPRDVQAEKAREPEPRRTAGSLAVDFGGWDLPKSSTFARDAPVDKPAFAQSGPADNAAFSTGVAPERPAPAQGAAAENPAPAAYQPSVASRVEAPAPIRVEPAAPELPPSLADAFAALLAAEQGLAAPQAAASRLEPLPARDAAPAVTDEVIEEIVGRVIARLTDQTVRETVLSIAERLVREEIERVKKGAP
jgi:CheY-like chemotaxis protein